MFQHEPNFKGLCCHGVLKSAEFSSRLDTEGLTLLLPFLEEGEKSEALDILLTRKVDADFVQMIADEFTNQTLTQYRASFENEEWWRAYCAERLKTSLTEHIDTSEKSEEKAPRKL